MATHASTRARRDLRPTTRAPENSALGAGFTSRSVVPCLLLLKRPLYICATHEIHSFFFVGAQPFFSFYGLAHHFLT